MLHISLRAEELFTIAGFPFTNGLLLSLIVSILLMAFALIYSSRLKLVPTGIQNIMEFTLEGALSLMDPVLQDRKKSERYLPLVLTIFIFIMISNWMGLLPLVGSLGLTTEHGLTPLLRAPGADLNFTLAIAIIAVLTTNILGAVALGIGTHLKKFFNFSNPIQFFIGILELISEFAKIISFSFRLFGNVFAGEVLLIIIGFLVPYLIPLPFLFLEMFVGFIQAFVFAMLTLVFVAMATTEHGEQH